MTFSSEAGLLVSKNTKKQVSGALFALNSGEDVIDAGASLNPDDITSREGQKQSPEMPQTCFPMIAGSPDHRRAHRKCCPT
jgi:hypothetical protein